MLIIVVLQYKYEVQRALLDDVAIRGRLLWGSAFSTDRHHFL